MSKTIVDMPKVCQMLDNGWHIELFKSQLKSYTAKARHVDPSMIATVVGMLWGKYGGEGQSSYDFQEMHTDEDCVLTDDWTPEQALTRLAYKCVDGVMI